MENKKRLSLILAIPAIILSVTLYKQFNFQTLQFEHTPLAIVYGITLIISLYLLLKNYQKQTKK